MAAKDILVIGCGPAGLAQLVGFAQSEAKLPSVDGGKKFNVTCFEKGSELGGLWTWSEKVGDDVHQSMYRYHQTNGLNEMLELPDYSFVEHFGHAITSYPPRAVMLDYLQGWAKKWKVEATYNRKVGSVTYNDESGKFFVTSEDTRDGSRHWSYFDYVIVATGHFSVPNYPPLYPGMHNFKGIVIHSHNFRDAKEFAGKRIMVIGNGYSGEDIAMQCVKFGATQATVCYRTAPMEHNFGHLPISESKLPESFDEATDEWIFADGVRAQYDALIYCTGYKHDFPFLSGDLDLKTPNRLIPDTLWKGILHPNNPKLMFLGMPDQYYTFSAFHAQGKFCIGVVEEKIEIPSKEDMLADTARWQEKEDNMGDDHHVHHRVQYEHTQEAAALAGFTLRDDSALFDQWTDDRHHNILTYRDQHAVSSVSGVTSLVFGNPWVMMFTDDKAAYLAWCKAEYEKVQREAAAKDD